MDKKLAEAVRFELTNPCGLPVFKTGAIDHSATLPYRDGSSHCILTSSFLVGRWQKQGLQIAQKIKPFFCGLNTLVINPQ